VRHDHDDSEKTNDSAVRQTWGPLPPSETFIKSGVLEKQLMDFSWKRSFVAITLSEIVFAADESSDVTDRIFLLDINHLETRHLVSLPRQNRCL